MAVTIGQRFAIGLCGTCIAIRFSLNICGLAWWQRVRRNIFITLYFCSLSHFTFQFSSKSHVQLKPNLVGMTIGWFSTKFCLFLFIYSEIHPKNNRSQCKLPVFICGSFWLLFCLIFLIKFSLPLHRYTNRFSYHFSGVNIMPNTSNFYSKSNFYMVLSFSFHMKFLANVFEIYLTYLHDFR